MMKKAVFAAVLAAAAAAALPAQTLTRFAVVDLTRVYSVFFMESRAVRELEQDSAAVQAEINRMTAEIQGLQGLRVDALARGDQVQVLRLESDIRGRTEFLREFHAVRTAELESRRRALARSDEFLGQIHGELSLVAEREGFAMVLDINAAAGILWHSPAIDITDALIRSLRDSRR